jgi:DNA-binding CsgD family transcriptional regulator
MSSTPHDQEPISVTFDVADEEQLSRMIMGWIARERRYRAIVTDKLKLVWANSSFLEKIQGSSLISVKDGHLASSPQGQSDITDALERCGFDAEHVWIGSSDSGFLMQIVRLEDFGSHYAFELVDQSPLPENLEPALHAAFGLTKAENRVLVQMLLGKPADEISRSLGVSVETVRSHIKRIYDKLSVSSRERLFSRLLPFAALG